MSVMELVLRLALASIVVFALVRVFMKRRSGGYQRRFDGTLHRHYGAPRDDGAFPITSTLYLGDGGGSDNAHHHAHSADCGHHSDGGASCSDGGSGN